MTMENDSIRTKLLMKRILERRDEMHLLLSPSGKITSAQRRHHSVFDGDLSKLSLSELSSLLSTVMDEMGAAGDIAASKCSMDEGVCQVANPRSRKRPRSEMTNHSILLFVERVMYERFSPFERNDGFINKEMKEYFGLQDVSFQAEEDVLCLAFMISLRAIKHTLGHQTVCGKSSEDDRIPDLIPTTSAIDTAFRVIDFIIEINKQERIARVPSRNNSVATRKYMSKRQRYQHLLKDVQTCRDQPEKKHNATLGQSISAIEEKYPNQWKWLECFRKKYNDQSAMRSNSQTGSAKGSIPDTPDQQSRIEEQVMGAAPGNVQDIVAGQEISVNVDDTVSAAKSSTPGFEEIGKATGECDTGLEEDAESKETSNDQTMQTGNLTGQSSAITPFDELDIKAHELRKSLISMSPSDLSHAVDHVTVSIVNLLRRYGDLDGAAGIGRCGDIINGAKTLQHLDSDSLKKNFHVCDPLVSSVTKEFLTDATGALRAKEFLRSFVLPLMLDMNPNIIEQSSAGKGKPASRLMTSLLASLARDRPMECVESVLIPTLVPDNHPSMEPNRFQCELIARVLKGKDALSLPAIALFLENMLPSNNAHEGMAWTEQSMPLLSACLNRQPQLSDDIIALLVKRIEHCLSPSASVSMRKSMKLSTVFHVLVSKYNQQVKAIERVELLKEAAGNLKTFMGKTIATMLEKL